MENHKKTVNGGSTPPKVCLDYQEVPLTGALIKEDRNGTILLYRCGRIPELWRNVHSDHQGSPS
eukprot:4175312-Pyramimonas_sp.AAC.1